MKYLKIILFPISIMFSWISCIQCQESLSRLGYHSGEIFPIHIDKYGCPNVQINYGNEPIWIIWDTGDMTGLVLSKEIIKKNSLTLKDSIRLRDSEGIIVGYSYTYVADSITIFDNLEVNVIISTATGDYNGLIGPRFVDLNRFTLDYQNRLIGISKGVLQEHKMNGEKLSMVKSKMLPRLIIVEGEVNGKKVLFEIDTGKSRTVIGPELVKELNLTEGKRGVIIKEIKLGNISLEVNNAKIKSFKGISKDLPKPIRIGIGSDLLQRFIMTVDYKKEMVVLERI